MSGHSLPSSTRSLGSVTEIVYEKAYYCSRMPKLFPIYIQFIDSSDSDIITGKKIRITYDYILCFQITIVLLKKIQFCLSGLWRICYHKHYFFC